MSYNLDEIVKAGEIEFLEFISHSSLPDKKYSAGDYIITQGQTLTEIAFVELGVCHVDYAAANGNAFSFGCFFCSNRIFGDVELFSGEPCQFSVRAYEDLSVKWVPLADVIQFMKTNPHVHFWLSRSLAAKYHNATRNTINQIINTIVYNVAWDAEQRLLNSRPNLTFTEAYKEAERFGCSSRVYRRAVKELLSYGFIRKDENKLVVSNFKELQSYLKRSK